MKNQKKVLLVTLSVFLAFNVLFCIKSFATKIEVGICDATLPGECLDDEGVFLQIGQWVYGDE
jgi:F0F1-type ATP synthase assembly protein I